MPAESSSRCRAIQGPAPHSSEPLKAPALLTGLPNPWESTSRGRSWGEVLKGSVERAGEKSSRRDWITFIQEQVIREQKLRQGWDMWSGARLALLVAGVVAAPADHGAPLAPLVDQGAPLVPVVDRDVVRWEVCQYQVRG